MCYHVTSCFLLDLLFQDGSPEFLPLNGNNFTIFVLGNTKRGVVGLLVALITCFTCDHKVHTCEHVTKIMESEEGMEHEMLDFVVDCFCSEKLSGIHSSFSKDLSQGR